LRLQNKLERAFWSIYSVKGHRQSGIVEIGRRLYELSCKRKSERLMRPYI